ncbi:45021_t:CDS:2, partial [Gigaspora margarita]
LDLDLLKAWTIDEIHSRHKYKKPFKIPSINDFWYFNSKRMRSQVANNFGNFNMQNATNFELAGINNNKALALCLNIMAN